MNEPERIASEILHQMAVSIIRDQDNLVRDIHRQFRQCEQMILLAKKELELGEAKSEKVA
jgi:hypothetical protein